MHFQPNAHSANRFCIGEPNICQTWGSSGLKSKIKCPNRLLGGGAGLQHIRKVSTKVVSSSEYGQNIKCMFLSMFWCSDDVLTMFGWTILLKLSEYVVDPPNKRFGHLVLGFKPFDPRVWQMFGSPMQNRLAGCAFGWKCRIGYNI